MRPPPIPRAANLIHYWPLRGNDGTDIVTGNVATQSGVATQPGRYFQAAQFIPNSKMNAGDLEVNDNNEFTIAAWIRLASAGMGTSRSIFSEGSTATANPILTFGVLSTDKARFFMRGDNNDNTNAADVTSATTLSADTWYHLACVLNASDESFIYVNGAQDGSDLNAILGALTTTDSTIGLLKRTSEVDFFDGNICELGIWNSVLTSGEIRSLAQLPTYPVHAF